MHPDRPVGLPDGAVPLAGGVANAGRVWRVGDRVVRPRGPHHAAIDALRAHVRSRGFTGVPALVAVRADGWEEVAWVPGAVATPPFPPWACADRWLGTTAARLRAFHDATVGFVPPAGADWSAELADPSGVAEVVAHNDVCPENVVCRDGAAVALLDLDLAAPGRRLWDLAALARMCVPLEADEDAARTGRGGLDAGHRLRVLADGYGLPEGRADLVAVAEEQLDVAEAFVLRRVVAGEAAFVAMFERLGGRARLARRRRWLAAHRAELVDALG